MPSRVMGAASGAKRKCRNLSQAVGFDVPICPRFGAAVNRARCSTCRNHWQNSLEEICSSIEHAQRTKCRHEIRRSRSSKASASSSSSLGTAPRCPTSCFVQRGAE